jgi:hypothetical protein
MGIGQKFRAISVTHPFSMNKKIDQFLSEELPDYMDEYKIADRTDISEIDGKFEYLEKRMDDLDSWRKNFQTKVDYNRNRMARLKVKFGVK